MYSVHIWGIRNIVKPTPLITLETCSAVRLAEASPRVDNVSFPWSQIAHCLYDINVQINISGIKFPFFIFYGFYLNKSQV